MSQPQKGPMNTENAVCIAELIFPENFKDLAQMPLLQLGKLASLPATQSKGN